MITDIELENFTAFQKLDISFSSRINVIIGSNGTGKTHLLKVIYALANLELPHQGGKKKKTETEAILSKKLLRLFLPTDNRVGALHADGAKKRARICIKNSDQTSIAAIFHNNSKKPNLESGSTPKRVGTGPVFIPTKEVLSLVRGIRHRSHDQATIEMIFDDTYLDLVEHLIRPGSENKNRDISEDPRISSLANELVDLIGGRYRLKDGSGFCFEAGAYEEKAKPGRSESKAAQMYLDSTITRFVSKGSNSLSSDMTAEGFRKIGVLHRLLCTGAFNQSSGGLLLWDEPETNLNPKLMKKLVQALLELSRNGQQIVLATHDYALLKWFDLLTDENKEDHVRYHALFRGENGNINVESTENYRSITPNAIAETFNDLTKEQVNKKMGGLGK